MENASWLNPVTARVFVTTRWTVIADCRQQDGTRYQDALSELCQVYWQPVYVCIRRHGHTVHDSQDLTQDFFVSLLKGTWLKQLDGAKGRFRAYLAASLTNFLHDKWRRRWTLRRGRGHEIIPMDVAEAEHRYLQAFSAQLSPEAMYEIRWATAILDNALEQLRIEMHADGKELLFAQFGSIIKPDCKELPYTELASRLGISAGALRAALHRWRKRFQSLIRKEIARTVTSKDEIEDELRHLHRVFVQAL